MPFSNAFVISSRFISMGVVMLMAMTLDVTAFSYKAVFVGLLFSHFAMGFYYSKANFQKIMQQKTALSVALLIMGVGVGVALYAPTTSKYYLIIHAALSDAYLLSLRSRFRDSENLALLRSVFYSLSFALLIVDMPIELASTLLGVALIVLVLIVLSVKENITLVCFELPLLAVVLYGHYAQITFPFHFLGFYHIMTWYVFSFWVLFVHEKNTQKTVVFFGKMIALSSAFVMLFTAVLGYDITDNSFLSVVGTFSILHIFSTIPLSKFNPRFIIRFFYPVHS